MTPRVLLPVALVAALAIGVPVVLLHRRDSGSRDLPKGSRQVASSRFDGSPVTPVRSAPPIDLRDSAGHRVRLSSYRGRPVLVTFLYVHCPDVCPLITAKLRAMQAQLGRGAARRVPIVAVSVDPRGDRPKDVARFLAQHDMTGRMEYLIGTPDELGRTWQAWNVGSKRDAASPTLVAHSALVYGITAKGKLETVYAANFKPRDIEHDLPLLAHG